VTGFHTLAAAIDVTEALTALFVVLLAAKLGDELFKRLGQPGIIGEVLAGVLVGPSVLALVEPEGAVELFAELGIVFLLFWVGLHTRLSDIREVGGLALRVGMLGAFLPLAGGLALGAALAETTAVSLFLGVALMATSVGITSAVLLDLGAVERPGARVVLGAAVVDDILALTLLSVAVGLAADDGVEVAQIAGTIALAVAFVVFVAVGGTRVTRRWPGVLEVPRFAESPLLPAVILCLGLAALAASIGLAAIVGAFLAGMLVAETREHHPVEQEIAPLFALFPPFFFAFIGAELPLGELADPETLGLLAAVTALAAVTKYVGAWLGTRGMEAGERRLVAVGMVPRGEVGIVVAGLGHASGVIDDRLFAAVVGMSVLTTLLVPPLLRRQLRRAPPPAAEPPAHAQPSADDERRLRRPEAD
jgi:Kef-type K+ transport system membrane component KefB